MDFANILNKITPGMTGEPSPPTPVDPFTQDIRSDRGLTVHELQIIYAIRSHDDTQSPEFLTLLCHLIGSRTNVSTQRIAAMDIEAWHHLLARVLEDVNAKLTQAILHQKNIIVMMKAKGTPS